MPKLAGFTKVALAPGATQTVTVAIPAASFDYWDEKSRRWKQWHGGFELSAGRSAGATDFHKRLTR